MPVNPPNRNDTAGPRPVDSSGPPMYEAPALVVLGSVAAFTLGSGHAASDLNFPGDAFST